MADGDGRVRLDGAMLGDMAQNRCWWRRAGPQEAEHTLHGVQGNHIGWPWGARGCKEKVNKTG
jgi:hypothetical protein